MSRRVVRSKKVPVHRYNSQIPLDWTPFSETYNIPQSDAKGAAYGAGYSTSRTPNPQGSNLGTLVQAYHPHSVPSPHSPDTSLYPDGRLGLRGE